MVLNHKGGSKAPFSSAFMAESAQRPMSLCIEDATY
jgi:hypothetical protein